MKFSPQVNYIKCKNDAEEYRMFYTAWGNQENVDKTLLCLHGLNRNSRDWDFVGQYFAARGYYVIAPDLVGRGNSDYLSNSDGYNIPFYVGDMFRLIQTLDLSNIHFIGTSLGGLIGMLIASNFNHPIQKLVMNDIGAEIDKRGLERISAYTSIQLEFNTMKEASDYLLSISQECVTLASEIFNFIVQNSFQKNSNGKYELKRDVNLSKSLAPNISSNENIKLWDIWEKVNIPVLVIHGTESDILISETIDKMKQIKNSLQLLEVPDIGHSPFLYSEEHFIIIEKFFNF